MNHHRTVPIVILLMLASASNAPAQDYTVYGTVTSELNFAWNELDSPATRLSVPLAARLTHSVAGEDFDLTARTVIITPPVDTAGDPGTGTSSISIDPASLATVAVPELSLTVYPAPWLTARAGRFDLDWGSTYIFSPGNALAAVGGDTPAAWTGASASILPGPATQIGAAVSLPTPLATTSANPWKELVVAAWADGLLAGIDWFTGIQYRPNRLLRPSLGVSVDIAGTILAADAAVEFAERYRYPTPAFAFEPRNAPLPIASVALQRSFMGQNISLNVIAEYLYTGLGMSDSEADRVYDLILAGTPDVSASEDGPSLGRNYAATQVSLEWYDTAMVTLSGTCNLNDTSLLASGEAAITALTALDVYLRGSIAWGESRRTEFGLGGTTVDAGLGVRLNL